MLIDFEKAFISISYKFKYNILNFATHFIKWVKLFDYNMDAYVLECENLSDKIKIQRGCRQGYLISLYLFFISCRNIVSFNTTIIKVL